MTASVFGAAYTAAFGQHRKNLLLLCLTIVTVLKTHAFLPVRTLGHANRGSLPSTAQVRHLVAPLQAAPAPSEEPPFWSLVFSDLFLLFDRTLDTVEDIGVHLRRATERDMDRRFRRDRLTTKAGTKKRVMILGTGWGGHAVTKVVDTGLYEVVIVSPRNFFLFTPMLAGSSVGTVDYRSIIEPIRAANPLADYYEAQGKGKGLVAWDFCASVACRLMARREVPRVGVTAASVVFRGRCLLSMYFPFPFKCAPSTFLLTCTFSKLCRIRPSRKTRSSHTPPPLGVSHAPLSSPQPWPYIPTIKRCASALKFRTKSGNTRNFWRLMISWCTGAGLRAARLALRACGSMLSS